MRKDYSALKDEYEQKIQRLEPSTCGSSSYAVANSDAITSLFELMGIKAQDGRNFEESLLGLLKKCEQLVVIKKNLEVDNKQLRTKLDEVIPSRLNIQDFTQFLLI